MADIVDPKTRSRMMAGISGKNTKPELLIRKALHGLGYRYRLHSRKLIGRPDIILPKYNAAIFVNGCFWHGHDCHLFKLPSTRTDFWHEKIESNRRRDVVAVNSLREQSWRVLTIWECAIKGKTRLVLQDMIDQITLWLSSDSKLNEIRGHN